MRKLILGLCLLLTVTAMFAQEAKFQELTGTVEFQRSGSSVWEKAVQGQTIMPDTIISTGFKSYALLSIGNSQITVRPLTRLSVKEISARTETETVNSSLATGRIHADINPPAGARASATVQTPMAVASVRGTTFEINIYELWVMEGSVQFTGTSGVPVIVDAGGYSYINYKTGWAVSPIEGLRILLDPDMPIGNDFEGTNSAQRNSTGGFTSPFVYK